ALSQERLQRCLYFPEPGCSFAELTRPCFLSQNADNDLVSCVQLIAGLGERGGQNRGQQPGQDKDDEVRGLLCHREVQHLVSNGFDCHGTRTAYACPAHSLLQRTTNQWHQWPETL